MEKVWLSDREVAARYGISRVSVWRWARNNFLPAPKKIGPATTRWNILELEKHDQREFQKG